ELILQFVDAIAKLLESSRILQDVETSDGHRFSRSYLDLCLAVGCFDWAGFLPAVFAFFEGFILPPALCMPVMPPAFIFIPDMLPEPEAFGFSKSSGKLSINALTKSMAESKL